MKALLRTLFLSACLASIGNSSATMTPSAQDVYKRIIQQAEAIRLSYANFQYAAGIGGVGSWSADYCQGRADQAFHDQEDIRNLAREIRQPLLRLVTFGAPDEFSRSNHQNLVEP